MDYIIYNKKMEKYLDKCAYGTYSWTYYRQNAASFISEKVAIAFVKKFTSMNDYEIHVRKL